MKVMKFGGSSLRDAACISIVSDIVKNYSDSEKVIVVVSAMKGITDQLISVFNRFKERNVDKAIEQVKSLYCFNVSSLDSLKLPKKKFNEGLLQINSLFGQLVTGLFLKNNDDLQLLDYIISFGEKLSARLVALSLYNKGIAAKYIDSSELIITNNAFGKAEPILEKTEDLTYALIYPMLIKKQVPVITGFFGRTIDGQITTLGRGGSDYTATILAYCLDAQEVILWKEVDGIYTSDPKVLKSAEFIPEISYEKAILLAQNGAKILHPLAIKPVAEKEIPVWIKNTFNPQNVGSKIWKGKNGHVK